MSVRKKLGYLPIFHKILSIPALLINVRKQFDQLSVETIKQPKISLTDVLLSGLAIFSFKFPSLLQYDQQRHAPKIKANLFALFGIKKTICDTQMRVHLDVIDSYLLRPTISSIHKKLQTNQVLHHFHYLNDQLLFSVDGTKYFQSNNVSCPHCNIKTKRHG